MTTMSVRTISVSAILIASGLAASALAQVPTYTTAPQICASNDTLLYHMDVLQGGDALSLQTTSPTLNNAGQVAFRFDSPSNFISGYWLGTPAAGGEIADTEINTSIAGFTNLSDPEINSAGQFVFSSSKNLSDLSSGYRVYRWDPSGAGTLSELFANVDPIRSIGFPSINNAGKIAFRNEVSGLCGTFPSSFFSLFTFDILSSTPNDLADESCGGAISTINPPAYLNDTAQTALVVTPSPSFADEIRRYNNDGSFITIVKKNDPTPDAGFSFRTFDTRCSINNNGDVAFVAERQTSPGNVRKERGVYLYKSATGTITRIAIQGDGNIAPGTAGSPIGIEVVPPVVNNKGLVCFRAQDTLLKRSVWVSDGTTTRKIAGEGSNIPRPPGQAGGDVFIIPTSTSGGSPIPGLGGRGYPALNDNGDVAFMAYLGASQVSTTVLGQAIIFVKADSVCYANCDGNTTAPLLSAADFTCFLNKFRAGDTYANCDGNTTAPLLSAADFTCFLTKFRAGCP